MIKIGIISLLVGVIFVFWSPHPLLFNLGSIFIGAGLVELLIQFFAVKDLTEKVVLEILDRLRFSLEAFYENRNSLPRLNEVLANVSEVWFAFHAGTVMRGGGLRGIAGLVQKMRIIVTHPDSAVVEQHAKIFNLSKETVQHGIKDLTREAQRRGVEIKWYNGPIANSVIIANPSSENSWAQLECLVPYADADDRPSFRVSLKKGKRALQTILAAYGQLWEESEEPPSEEVGKQSLPSKHD